MKPNCTVTCQKPSATCSTCVRSASGTRSKCTVKLTTVSASAFICATCRIRTGVTTLVVRLRNTAVPGTRAMPAALIHPQFLAKTVSELAAEDAVFTVDVGTPTIWAARYLKLNGRRRLIGSFNHGSMANAMPQAIGAQATYLNRQVISLSGDGGFTMLMGDLLTLVQHKLPLKVVVFNNGTLGFVELEMKAAGFLETGVELVNPDFAAMARAAGLFAQRVEDPADLADAARAILAHDGPAPLDVVTAWQKLAMPPKIGAKQVAGFSLWVAPRPCWTAAARK